MNQNIQLAKNTILLYFRMILLLLITLYTSRVVLKELGVSDFGIYSIVQGVVISFTFFNSALILSSQRFLAYTLGEGDRNKYAVTFNTCLCLFLMIGLAFCVIIEPVGVYLIQNKLVIPVDRISSATYLFHYTIFNVFLSFVNIPFRSALIAEEKMSFFAYLGVFEGILKLAVVLSLSFLPGDKLIIYGILLLISTIITSVINVGYVIKNLNIRVRFCYNKLIGKEIFTFSWWSFYSGLTNMAKLEGTNFCLNFYYGVIANAAIGIAKQVNSAVSQFVGNFQTAFKPQITKAYASEDNSRLEYLIINASKFSAIIFLFLAIPICFNVDTLLEIWLGQVPDYANAFSISLIISTYFETIGGPLWITSHAIGNIRNFQLITGTIRLLSLPFMVLYLAYSVSPLYALGALVFADFFVFIYRLWYIVKKTNIKMATYNYDVMFKTTLLIIIVCLLLLPIKFFISNAIVYMFASTAVSVCATGTLTWFYIMTTSQRKLVADILKRKIGYKNAQ